MRIIIILLFSFIFVGCSPNNVDKKTTNISDEQLVNEISKKVARKLFSEKQLHLFGTGAQMRNKIKMMALSFNCYSPVDQDEARELLLIAVDEFIAEINQDERIRPFLNNFPFDPSNVQIRIFLRNSDGSNPILGNLVVISAVDGKFEYEIDDPKSVLFTTILKESYEEAILKHSQAIALKSRKAEVPTHKAGNKGR